MVTVVAVLAATAPLYRHLALRRLSMAKAGWMTVAMALDRWKHGGQIWTIYAEESWTAMKINPSTTAAVRPLWIGWLRQKARSIHVHARSNLTLNHL
jgi:hypothetical protein